jgi:hypothetical protein
MTLNRVSATAGAAATSVVPCLPFFQGRLA